jgi:hypothetical protein
MTESIYWGEHDCSSIVKSTSKNCTNKAYYKEGDKLLCGVHSKKERVLLPKNPDRDKIKKEMYLKHLKKNLK